MQVKPEINEPLLWKEFLDGDQNSLTKIYLNNVNALYDFGCKFTVDRSFVKDCIQDMFITLIQTRTNLSETQHVKGYLLKSLKRKIIKESVKKQKFEEIVETGDYRFEIEFQNIIDLEYESDTHSLKTLAVRSAIESLTSRQKEALYLRFNLGLSHKEIAHVLHLTEQSSRALVSRAIQKIRDVIHLDKKHIKNILLFLFGSK